MTRRIPRRLVAVLLSLLSVPAAVAAPAAPPSSAEDAKLGRALDAFAKPLVDADQLSGQLLVARHGRIVLERFYGYANRELRVPVTADTRFCVASVTKPMTGTIAIQLLAERKFGLQDSIAKWFPDFPKGDRIRITHLLRHRSGIPHELLPDSESTRPMTTADMVAIAARRPLDHDPDARGGYSSGGYTVLTRILELVSGKPYAALLEERIFGPLGMTQTSDHDSRAILPGRASPYVPGPHGNQNGRFQDFSSIAGAGSVWSTARDLHRFVQGVARGQLGEGPKLSYVRDGRLDFNGLVEGFRAFCEYDTATGLEVIFAGNLQNGAGDLLRAAIPKLAAGEAVAPPAFPALRGTPVTAAEAAPLLGRYRLENGTVLNLTFRDGALWTNAWVLLPMKDGGYFSPRDYGKVRGVAGADGRMTRLDWEQRGQVYPAPRVGE